MQRSPWNSYTVFFALLALITLGTVTRLALRDLPNFAPVAALALFAGYVLPCRRLAVLVPLGVMAASDCVIGGYDLRLMAVVYSSLAAPAWAGHWLQNRFGMSQKSASGWAAAGMTAGLVGSSLASSIFFFITTNFGVWALGSSYAHTWTGLVDCYLRAVPFFRYTLAGDLFFASVLFSAYAVVLLALRRPASAIEVREAR
ncbi:MAG: DUF6580 family putative transport protein [Pirellulales bacterium]